MSRKLLIQSVLSTIESNQNVKLTQRAAGEIVDSVFNTITNQLQTTGVAKTVLGTFRVVYVECLDHVASFNRFYQ